MEEEGLGVNWAAFSFAVDGIICKKAGCELPFPVVHISTFSLPTLYSKHLLGREDRVQGGW